MVFWWGHGSSAGVLALLVAVFVLRAVASRRRPVGGGQASRFAPPPRPGSPAAGGGLGPEPGGTGADRAGFTGVPAGWLPDPAGRYERRYWSGTGWTEHVTSGGVPAADPPPGSTGTGDGGDQPGG